MSGSGERKSSLHLLRLGLGLALAGSVLAASASQAAAHGSYEYGRHHHRRAALVAATDNPPFSAIVVDENTGRELYGVNEDALRHPASITKVMTLYLLFEELEKGTVTLESQIPISEHAAAQEPSKLGIAAGDSLRVEDAIKAVVTRSANDVAVAIAEKIGQDETTFATMMTRKAHALGMSRTLYRNASGLPNDEQWTTARDLTVLARSLETRFPQYFRYFSTHEFDYDGEIIGNHNHLLGKVAGVDGIKTGYTRASGFNLLTSVHRDGRSLVAVVMGGHSAAARDRTMEALIETHIAEASNHGHTATAIADNESPVAASFAPRRGVAPNMGGAGRAGPAKPSVEIGEGDNEDEPAAAPVKPIPAAAKSPATKPEETKLLKVAPQVATRPTETPSSPVNTYAVASANPAALGWKKGAEAAAKASTPRKPQPPAEETRVARSEGESKPEPGHLGWIIQIGAADDAAKANALLSKARGEDRRLADAKPFTEKFNKRGGTFYRARFSGLNEASAEQACKTLRRSGFPCFASHVE
jgi:D-alanyl-D-alanine carboxypeptidase